MGRVLSAALPAMLLLLAACSDRPVAQKADLQQAAGAARTAGEAETAQKYAPMQLGPYKQAATGKPAVTKGPGAKKAQAVATSNLVPAAPRSAGTVGGQTSRPAAIVAVATVTQPIAAGPVSSPGDTSVTAPVKVVEQKPVNGTAIHLASYREIGSAERGWQILSKDHRELAPLKPLYVAVDLPGKGRVLRLYGTGADARTLKEICGQILAAGAYCADNIAF